VFKITERQYQLIMQQAQASYPNETGGILGGHADTILGVLPIVNKFFPDPKKTFGISTEDIERAYHFLTKHRLEYLGVYHTHPRGIASPSEQDLAHRQKYLFIIGLADRFNPELYAWRVEGNHIYQEDIKIISDLGVTVVDVRTGQPKLSQNLSRADMNKLVITINDWITGKAPEYPKIQPGHWDPSSFSTFA
jgi:proteasome lid subunit RPN8/RPN11